MPISMAKGGPEAENGQLVDLRMRPVVRRSSLLKCLASHSATIPPMLSPKRLRLTLLMAVVLAGCGPAPVLVPEVTTRRFWRRRERSAWMRLEVLCDGWVGSAR